MDKYTNLTREALIAKCNELDKDIETLGVGIIGALKALGVKDFDNIDTLGKQLMKGVPSLIANATIFPKLTAKKFELLTPCLPLLDKYSHLKDKI